MTDVVERRPAVRFHDGCYHTTLTGGEHEQPQLARRVRPASSSDRLLRSGATCGGSPRSDVGPEKTGRNA